jgi:flagellar protein FliS
MNSQNKEVTMNTSVAMKQYRQNHIQGGIETATPHRLVQMLMEGALEKLIAAKAFMAKQEIAKKGEHISWTISIIDSLRSSLNVEVGGDFAQNLLDLYNYMERRLLEANINNDPAMLDEVAQLIIEIKSGWDAIPAEFHTPAKTS